MDFTVVASTSGDYPFSRDHIGELLDGCKPDNMVQLLLERLKSTSSKHKYIVTATKIATDIDSQDAGTVSCQTGTLWDNKKDGYLSLQIKDKELEKGEPVAAVEDDKRPELLSTETEELKERDTVLATETHTDHTEPNVLSISPANSGASELVHGEADRLAGVSTDIIPPEAVVPISVGEDKPPETEAADIDEAVGSTPETQGTTDPKNEPVMLAAVGPEEAEKIMRERDGLNVEETPVTSELITPGAFVHAGADGASLSEAEPQDETAQSDDPELEKVKPATDTHVKSNEEDQKTGDPLDDVVESYVEVDGEPATSVAPELPALSPSEPSASAKLPPAKRPTGESTENLQSESVQPETPGFAKTSSVAKHTATTYMVTIYWVYVH